MVLKEFKCQMCGYRFEVEIVEAEGHGNFGSRPCRLLVQNARVPESRAHESFGILVVRGDPDGAFNREVRTLRAQYLLTEPLFND